MELSSKVSDIGDFISSSLWSWSPAVVSNFCGSVCNKWLLAIFNELWQILITDFECLSQQSKSLVKLPLQEWADLTIFADDQNLPVEHIKVPIVLLASCSLGTQSNLLSVITATYYSSQQTEKSTVFLAILRVTFLMLQVFSNESHGMPLCTMCLFFLLWDNFLEPQTGLEANGNQPVMGSKNSVLDSRFSAITSHFGYWKFLSTRAPDRNQLIYTNENYLKCVTKRNWVGVYRI